MLRSSVPAFGNYFVFADNTSEIHLTQRTSPSSDLVDIHMPCINNGIDSFESRKNLLLRRPFLGIAQWHLVCAVCRISDEGSSQATVLLASKGLGIATTSQRLPRQRNKCLETSESSVSASAAFRCQASCQSVGML